MKLTLIKNDENVQETKEYKEMFGEGTIMDVKVEDASSSPQENYLAFIHYLQEASDQIQAIEVFAVDNDDDYYHGYFEDEDLQEAKAYVKEMAEDTMYYVKARCMIKGSFTFITYHLNQFMEIESDIDNFESLLLN